MLWLSSREGNGLGLRQGDSTPDLIDMILPKCARHRFQILISNPPRQTSIESIPTPTCPVWMFLYTKKIHSMLQTAKGKYSIQEPKTCKNCERKVIAYLFLMWRFTECYLLGWLWSTECIMRKTQKERMRVGRRWKYGHFHLGGKEVVRRRRWNEEEIWNAVQKGGRNVAFCMQGERYFLEMDSFDELVHSFNAYCEDLLEMQATF